MPFLLNFGVLRMATNAAHINMFALFSKPHGSVLARASKPHGSVPVRATIPGYHPTHRVKSCQTLPEGLNRTNSCQWTQQSVSLRSVPHGPCWPCRVFACRVIARFTRAVSIRAWSSRQRAHAVPIPVVVNWLSCRFGSICGRRFRQAVLLRAVGVHISCQCVPWLIFCIGIRANPILCHKIRVTDIQAVTQHPW